MAGGKPGTRDFARRGRGAWPVGLGRRRRLEAAFGGPGTRQFITVRRRRAGATGKERTGAVERALERAAAAAVRLIREHRREEPVGLVGRDGRPHRKRVGVPTPHRTVSSSLTAGVAS